MNIKEIQRLIVDTILCHSIRKHTCPTSYMIRDTMSCSGGIDDTINPCENVAENGICIYCSRIAITVR